MTKILQNRSVLAVHDVRASAKFYVDVLGFRVIADFEGWIFVQRDACVMMLGECSDDMHPSQLGCHNYFAYLVVDDADALLTQVQAADVRICKPIVNEPWGMREFGIVTHDGHRIMIGQTMASA